jgi:chromate transporter
MREYLEIYLCFLKIGSIAFGGGYALLPILQKDLDENRHWATTEELMDYFAIGQCTPGVIAVNVATFIGYKKKGIMGALAANLGFLTVPVILILIIAAFLSNFAELDIVKHAFGGIRVCVCVLIIQAVLRLWKKSIVDKITLAMAIIIFLLAAVPLPFSVPTALLVVLAGLCGILLGNETRSLKDGDPS